MALEYVYPRVAFDESDVGPRPTQGVSLSTIGLIGTFSKGPLNQVTEVGSLDELVNVFGGYKAELTGYKSAAAALSQGANDLKIVRIGGNTVMPASKMLADEQAEPQDSVEIKAKTPGTWGNDIQVAVTAGTTNGTFKLIVIYAGRSEEFDNLTLDNVASIKSAYITASPVAGAAQIPKAAGASYLTNGDDGADAADEDYIGTIDDAGKRTGLKLLETVRVSIVICAQQSSTMLQNALITHCANVPVEKGLRMAVLNTPKATQVNDAAALTATLDSMRAILAYPWLEHNDMPGEYIAPDGFYAGILSVIDSNKSPSNKQVLNVLSIELDFAPIDLKKLTNARISPIALEENRGYRIKNGVTLSSDTAWNQTNIRRIFDEIELEVFDATQWAKSENNTPELGNALATRIDDLLETKKLKEKIYDYKPTISDDTNNPPEVIQARIRNTKTRVRPTYAADFIDHNIQRLVGNEQ